MTWLLLPLAYFGLAFMLYCTSMFGDWLFDDHTGLLTDPQVLTGKWKKRFYYEWRWLLTASYVLNSIWLGRLYGPKPVVDPNRIPDPSGFHIVNVVIHGINGMIVSWVILALGMSDRGALMAGLLFIAHPLNVNAVAAISNRGSVLSGTFYFAGIGFALLHLPILALLMIPLALSVKQDTATLPIILGIIGYWKHDWILLSATFAMIPLAIVGWKQIAWLRKHNGEEGLTDAGFPPSPFHGSKYYVTIIAETILQLPQWSVGLHQNIDADVKEPSWSRCVMAGLLLGSVLALWYVSILTSPILAMLLAFILISPLVTYFVFELPDLLAEHRAYITAMGIAGLIAYVLQ